MNNLINILKSIKNPQQAKTLMLEAIEKNRPDIANYLKSMMNSGMPPKEALRKSIADGKLSKNDFYKMKNLLSTYGRFLPFNISQKDLNEVECEFNNIQQTRF